MSEWVRVNEGVNEWVRERIKRAKRWTRQAGALEFRGSRRKSRRNALFCLFMRSCYDNPLHENIYMLSGARKKEPSNKGTAQTFCVSASLQHCASIANSLGEFLVLTTTLFKVSVC